MERLSSSSHKFVIHTSFECRKPSQVILNIRKNRVSVTGRILFQRAKKTGGSITAGRGDSAERVTLQTTWHVPCLWRRPPSLCPSQMQPPQPWPAPPSMSPLVVVGKPTEQMRVIWATRLTSPMCPAPPIHPVLAEAVQTGKERRLWSIHELQYQSLELLNCIYPGYTQRQMTICLHFGDTLSTICFRQNQEKLSPNCHLSLCVV